MFKTLYHPKQLCPAAKGTFLPFSVILKKTAFSAVAQHFVGIPLYWKDRYKFPWVYLRNVEQQQKKQFFSKLQRTAGKFPWQPDRVVLDGTEF